MKIFFFSTVFAPSVGGIEKLAETLCTEFVAMGHQVYLATTTPASGEDGYSFPVVRRPGLGRILELMNWCDIHIQANVSLKYIFPRFRRPNRFLYQHNNVYQRDDGTLAPADRLKRLIARRTPAIANSHYTASKLCCAHTVFNAYDDATFRVTLPWEARDGDLVFLGRLVSQKGCDVLLHALGRLRKDGLEPRLTIIGDGPDLKMLKALAQSESIGSQVRFTGTIEGPELATELNRHRFLVVPSRYEEPFGIVALEGLACGCIPIVSERGGLVDAIGGHGFTFPNGDDVGLASILADVLREASKARNCLKDVETHLDACRARAVADRYVAIFNRLLEARN